MSHDKHAPRLPEVVDEAADTPSWVPALGLGLFAVVAIVVAIQLASAGANPAEQTVDAAQAAAAVDAGPAP
jgi:protein-S-isoprenylcysteine O-methyltransferase Ste14